MAHLLLAVIYICFISLGLPDAVLGSAWPVMYQQFGVAVSYAGIIYAIISMGTVVSSLMTNRLHSLLGSGKLTALSVGVTMAALFGFSISTKFWMILLWAVPYGLGAGSVDACLNNYVALHYASRHMSWLHCMWGIGASTGPYIMSMALTGGSGWAAGYRYLGLIQLALTAMLFLSLPLWRTNREAGEQEQGGKALSLRQTVRISGAKEIMLAFFCYCALEQTAGLWASSYLVLHKGLGEELAAKFASLFFIGITVGRLISGFLTMRLNDGNMIRLGQGLIAIGITVMLLPVGSTAALVGLVVIGLGCAPIYPCIIHSTPAHFGAEHSQALIGVQMASAYVGNCLMPPLFGLIANHVTVALLPVYLLILLAVQVGMHERLLSKERRAALQTVK